MTSLLLFALLSAGIESHIDVLPVANPLTNPVTTIEFDTTNTCTAAEGELEWDSVAGTLCLGVEGGTVVLQIGQEVIVPVRNDTASQIDNGKLVHQSGFASGRPQVQESDNTALATARVDWILTEDCAAGAECFATTLGWVRGLNTAAFSAGDALWLSTTGDWTNVKPTHSTSTWVVPVGWVLFSNASNGVVYVVPSAAGDMMSQTLVADADGNSFVASTTDDNIFVATGGTQKLLIGADVQLQGSANFNLNDGQIYGPTPTISTPTGTTQTIDWDNGNAQTLDLESATGDVTVTFSNSQASASYILEVVQDSATARNVVWPATVKWPGGLTPTITTTNDAIDVVSCYYNGATHYCNIGQDYQ